MEVSGRPERNASNPASDASSRSPTPIRFTCRARLLRKNTIWTRRRGSPRKKGVAADRAALSAGIGGRCALYAQAAHASTCLCAARDNSQREGLAGLQPEVYQIAGRGGARVAGAGCAPWPSYSRCAAAARRASHGARARGSTSSACATRSPAQPELVRRSRVPHLVGKPGRAFACAVGRMLHTQAGDCLQPTAGSAPSFHLARTHHTWQRAVLPSNRVLRPGAPQAAARPGLSDEGPKHASFSLMHFCSRQLMT